MRKTGMLIIALLLGAVGSAFADGVTYDVTVDTSSISGTSGSLDFQFDSGPFTSQAASLQILGFTTDGTLGASVLTGDVTGNLPGTVLFDNGTSYNDYFTGFTYGTTLSFSVNLFGPAVDAPDGVSTSGSVFAFSMFSDAAGSVPVLTSDQVNGFALVTDINLDGSTTLANNSAQTTATQEGGSVPTPEPSSLALMLGGTGLLGLLMMRKRVLLG